MRRLIFCILMTLAPFTARGESAGESAAGAGLDAVAFLEGHWRGGESFVFEEIWSAPAGGVMTGMARGVADDALRVLEYIIIAEDEDGALVMRFKHFNADFSTWEDAAPANGEPVELALVSAGDKDVVFAADPPSAGVSSIRYRMTGPDTLQADVALVEDGAPGGFTLVFNRAD